MALPNDPAPTPNLLQANSSSDTWDPVTISNVIFSAIMVFTGIIAIWQARQAHRRTHRALDEEEIFGSIQLLSRASTMLSNASPGLPPLQLPQATQASDNQENNRELTPAAMADTLNDTPVDAHNCL